MKLVSDFYNKAASFNQNDDGGILPLTALLLTGFMLAGGAAIDYSRYASAKNIMNTALDAAILDAGVRLGEGQPVDQKFEDDFNAFFNVNIAGRGGFTDNFTIVDFSADEETGRVNASAAASVETTLMKVGGFDKLDISTESSGVFEQTDTEVTIMLDVTGSMGGSKIRALRSAASEAVDILLPKGTNTRSTRVGIVPYASSVNAHRYASAATRNNNNRQVASAGGFSNASNNVPTSKCVTGRGGRDAATDTSYENAPVGSDRRSISNSNAFFRCPTSKIMPLTNDASALKLEISGMDADGFTAGHLGIAWSYYMLSPKWKNLWDSANEPAPYSSDVNKVAILMTDGVFNTAYDGVGNGNREPFDSREARGRSQQVSADLCSNMKNSGITVYSIAFELKDNTARDLLDNCATDDKGNQVFFYRADNEDELREAFREIARNISSLRLTQ